MKKIEIAKITSLNRAPLIIEGYLFEGCDPEAPSIAVVGAMEGKNILPLYTASKLVDFLKNNISGKESIKGDILVIPSINHYALNINERFWPLDKTDINMMFPGYALGETTQRIAKKVFDVLQNYTHGIILENREDLSSCIPYVKLFQSGFEDLQGAKLFGFKLIHHKELTPINTVSLQYNWQLWGTKAYSIVCPNENQIDINSSHEIFEGIIQYLNKNRIIDYKVLNGFESTITTKEDVEIIKTPKSGIFIATKQIGSYVIKDEMIGKIVHSLNGEVIHRFFAPSNGMIVCGYKNALIFEDAVAFRIVKSGS
ncbi:succinylglutamate desuccinylase/aspartoacylase family protein [bacterium]|nr:succinylglutamate desuccinylase/aspartoacylase family protein [bacterium]MBU1989331.1 succinylglutamate desuccinylase/aspartoacylase family protein [bacterium]